MLLSVSFFPVLLLVCCEKLFFVMYVLHRGLLKCFTLIFFLPCYLKYNQLQPVIGFWPVLGVTWTSKCCRTESVWSESSNRTYKLIWKAFTQVIKKTSVQLYAAAFVAPCWTLQVQATFLVLLPSLFSLCSFVHVLYTVRDDRGLLVFIINMRDRAFPETVFFIRQSRVCCNYKYPSHENSCTRLPTPASHMFGNGGLRIQIKHESHKSTVVR